MQLRDYGYVWIVIGMAGCATLVDADAPYQLDETEMGGAGGTMVTTSSGAGGTSVTTSNGAGGINASSSGTGGVETGSQVASSASSSGASSSSGGIMCISDANCPPGGGQCTAGKCNSGTCSIVNEPAGTSCIGGQCDGNGSCKSGAGLGAACQIGSQCASGFCADNVCCSTQCDGLCMTCTGGACGAAPFGSQETGCTLSKVCDGAGACKKANGQNCFSNSECASGNCTGTPPTCQ